MDDIRQFRRLAAEAAKARAESRNDDYLARSEEAARRRPHMPGALLALARAHAVNGQNDKALALLEKIAAMGLAVDLEANADFAALKNHTRFQAIVARMRMNTAPLIKSAVAFTLPDKDFLPEGIAHDAKTGAFYVASVHQGRIVKRLPSGETRTFAADAPDGWSVLAIAVDARRRLLWAATAAMDQTRGAPENDLGRTAIVKFDLDRETRLARLELPRDKVARTFGDLLLADNGDLYVSESREGALYRVAQDKLETFIPPGTFASPQGMAWFGHWLMVADYSLGLLRVDMDAREKTVTWLPPPADTCLLGLDGMAIRRGRLIATQNGIAPPRLVAIDLDADARPAKLTVLEANHPLHREPTLGVMVGDDFYYVANSQWELFERGKPPPLEKLQPPAILKLTP